MLNVVSEMSSYGARQRPLLKKEIRSSVLIMYSEGSKIALIILALVRFRSVPITAPSSSLEIDQNTIRRISWSSRKGVGIKEKRHRQRAQSSLSIIRPI